MTTEAEMTKLLNDRLINFRGGAFLSKLKMENDRDFVAPVGEMHITQNMHFIPPKLVGQFVEGGQYRLMANYELTVEVPLNSGMVEARALASELVSWFHRGLNLKSGSAHVRVEKSFQSGKVEGPKTVSLPVTVEVWSYAPYV